MHSIRTIGIVVGIIFFGTLPLFQGHAFANSQPTVEFFYSSSCPYCHKEQAFLDTLEEQYPELKVERYIMSDAAHYDLLERRARETGAERYVGMVPLTFIGDSYVLGFDTPSTTGARIVSLIEEEYGFGISATSSPASSSDTNTFFFFGYGIDVSHISLPATAVVLGTLDGFNVCSLGALVLILGLVLSLGSRKKIILYGGGFILTTAVIYGLLIVAWHHLFSYLSPYVMFMEALIAVLGIGGGIYFLREFRRFRTYGVTCETGSSPFVTRITTWVQSVFQRQTRVIGMIAAVLVFAALLTIVEFPCSAAVPVLFAGLLAEAQLSPVVYGGYISLFVFFYMLDELIIFGIAVYRLNIWLMSPRFTTWAALGEGLALLGIGLYYLLGLIVF